jgi:anti-anti-sigma regulatory factor
MIMIATLDADVLDETHQCPVCGQILPYQVTLFVFDAPCPACGILPWCRVSQQDDSVILEVFPGRTPSMEDIASFIDLYVRSDGHTSVLCDLSALDRVSSSFVARLLTLNKRLGFARCHLLLCGIGPVVGEVFSRLGLERLFEMVDDQQAVGRRQLAVLA